MVVRNDGSSLRQGLPERRGTRVEDDKRIERSKPSPRLASAVEWRADARSAPADSRLWGGFSLDSLRRRGVLFDPFAELLGELGVRQWRLHAAIARLPAPQHQLVVRDVLQQLLQRLAAVSFGVLQLVGQLARALALEDQRHILPRQLPRRVAGRHVLAREVGVLVTVRALQRVLPLAVLAALDVLDVQ